MKTLSVSALVLALGTALMAAPQSTPNPAPSTQHATKPNKAKKLTVKHHKKNKTAAPARHK